MIDHQPRSYRLSGFTILLDFGDLLFLQKEKVDVSPAYFLTKTWIWKLAAIYKENLHKESTSRAGKVLPESYPAEEQKEFSYF